MKRQTEHWLDSAEEDLILIIESRYPGDLGLLPDGKPSKEIAGKFYGLAKEIHEKIEDFLWD